MTESASNLLELENPQAYTCRVEYYGETSGEMTVLVDSRNEADSFTINFAGIFYFSGRLKWQDATLRLASDDEHHQFVRQIMPVASVSDVELANAAKYGHLYIFEGSGFPIRILAYDCNKIEHYEDW